MKSLLLVIDIGTTSVKAVLFTTTGTLVRSSTAAYRTQYPQSGWAEQDPENYWKATVEAVSTLVDAGVDATAIEAIGLSGHMNGCLLIDSSGKPTYPHIIHADSRSSRQCSRIDEIWGQKHIYERTGNRIDEHLSLPKLLWIQENHPEAVSSSAYFINAKDFIRFKLTGILGTTDFSDASLTGIFNPVGRTWDYEIADSLGLQRNLFCDVHASTEVAGPLVGEVAGLLGLRAGIPVSYGGGDAACATRGAGVSTPGQGYAALGSSAWVSTLAQQPQFDDKMRMQHFLDLEGELCNVCGTVQSASIALDWIRQLLKRHGSGREDLNVIEGRLEKLPVGSMGVLFLPYLMGERTPHWDARARGAYIGLSLSTDTDTLIRATYEGVAFALADCMDVYDDLALPIRQFTLLGGAARSTFWQRMIAEVLGRQVSIHPYPSQATALGAAYAAGVSVGMWKDIGEAIAASAQRQNTQAEIVIPDRQRTDLYRQIHAIYRQLYPAMDAIHRQLERIRDTHV